MTLIDTPGILASPLRDFYLEGTSPEKVIEPLDSSIQGKNHLKANRPRAAVRQGYTWIVNMEARS
jgi:hypothetical protein